ncbi:MAG TPA: Gfo/Idh/MocA family oxidoreductase [Ignavibacteria bacterium]|jgi:predicted dehydrogenase
MSLQKLNIGLAGCGHLGNVHARLLSEIASSDTNISFAGVYDIETAKSNGAANKYNVKAFDTLEKLLSKIDTLIIVTSTPSHYETAKEALKKNINLFIEKPVTSSLKEAGTLIDLAKKTNVKIQVGHVERFNPALTSLGSYKLKPMFIESHRLAQFNPRGTDVSVIQDLMIHDIDIILNLVKSPIEKIDANGVSVISNNIDIANARLTFSNGCVANVTSSRISLKKMRKMRIFQPNAYISIDFLNNKSEVFKLVELNTESKGLTYPVSDTKKIIYEEPPIDTENINPIKNELETFFNSILEDKPVKVTLEEGKQAVEVADRIMKIIK